MTNEGVRAWVSMIRSIAHSGDDEFAHSEEDKLRAAVLGAIADGAENPQLLAQEAIQTKEISFHRWCA